jgi:hypothetical protein
MADWQDRHLFCESDQKEVMLLLHELCDWGWAVEELDQELSYQIHDVLNGLLKVLPISATATREARRDYAEGRRSQHRSRLAELSRRHQYPQQLRNQIDRDHRPEQDEERLQPFHLDPRLGLMLDHLLQKAQEQGYREGYAEGRQDRIAADLLQDVEIHLD